MLKPSGNWKPLALALGLLTGAAACSDNGQDPVVPSAPATPAAPSLSLVAEGVQVSWSAVAGADGYVVERDVVGDAAGFAEIASGVTETELLDTDVSVGTTYQYRVIATAGGLRSAASDPRDITLETEGPRTATLSGTIRGTRQLSADTTYLLQGIVRVAEGGVLRVPAGTTLLGDVNVAPTALVIEVGGQIFAEGTADAPIVFTSSAPVGERGRGDWGGLLIAGDSFCNFELPCRSEGVEVLYGGNDEDDNSGVLRYVRVEFAGYEASPGNELNAISLFGVGRGTTLEYVQAHMGSDDGIELFGGTVDIQYAIATGNEDDSFDYSTGWQGRGQFWIAQQSENAGDKGFEVDGNESSFTATPLTDPTIYNVTLIGQGEGSSDAILLRRGVSGEIRNAIVLNFGGGAFLDVDQSETVAFCTEENRLIEHIITFNVQELFDGDSDEFESACAGSDIRQVDPMLVAPLDRSSPNFQPSEGSPALRGAAAVPADDFFEAADYLGAVAPTGTPWYEGWIATAVN